MRNQKTSFWICTLLLLIAAYFPVFHHLDFLPMWNYDEARCGVNALEMREDGLSLVPTFREEPDNWSTKPPLLIWTQVMSTYIFGPSELAIRLPSALAGLATIFLIFFFVYKRSGSLAWAFFSALGLLTFLGYCDYHVVRTGDYDALLTLFTTSCILSLFRSFESQRPLRWIILSALFLWLATMTKGVVIFLFGPGIILYLLFDRKFSKVTGNYRYYLWIGLAIGLWLSYYFIRNGISPGYLKAVWENELGGRFGQTIESHKNVFWYYVYVLLDAPLYLFAPLAFFLFPREPDQKVTSFIFYLGWVSFGFWLFLSIAQTKIRWYAAPMMPLLSIMIGYSIHRIIELVQVIKFEQRKSALISIIMCIVFFFAPYRLVIDQVFKKKNLRDGWEDAQYGWMMKKLATDYPSFSVVRNGYNASIDFYSLLYRQTSNTEIHPRYAGDYGRSEKILFCDKEQINVLDASYRYEILEALNDCLFVKIIEPIPGLSTN